MDQWPERQGCVDDFWGPDINSIPVALPQFAGCSPVPYPDSAPDDGWTNSFADIQCYDSLHVQAVLNQIDGYNHDRTRKVGVPALFGTNFQSVSVGEKLAVDPVSGLDRRRRETWPVGDRLDQAPADREYALEARKRLYAAIGPLRFLRPLTLTQLIERQVAFADFSVDSGAAELLCFKKAAFACFNGSSLVEGHPRVDWIDEKEHVFYDHLARAADSLIVAPTGQEGRCMRYAEFEAAIGTATGLAAVVPFGELLKDFTPKGKPLLWLRLVAYGSLCNDFINRVGASIGFENRPFDIGHLLTAANDATILAAIDGYTERCAAMARSTL